MSIETDKSEAMDLCCANYDQIVDKHGEDGFERLLAMIDMDMASVSDVEEYLQ